MARPKNRRQILERSCNNVSKVKDLHPGTLRIASIWNPQRFRLHKEPGLLWGSWLSLHNVRAVQFIWKTRFHFGLWIRLGGDAKERKTPSRQYAVGTETGGGRGKHERHIFRGGQFARRRGRAGSDVKRVKWRDDKGPGRKQLANKVHQHAPRWWWKHPRNLNTQDCPTLK